MSVDMSDDTFDARSLGSFSSTFSLDLDEENDEQSLISTTPIQPLPMPQPIPPPIPRIQPLPIPPPVPRIQGPPNTADHESSPKKKSGWRRFLGGVLKVIEVVTIVVVSIILFPIFLVGMFVLSLVGKAPDCSM